VVSPSFAEEPQNEEQKENEVNINDFKTPSLPAFALLDADVSSVIKPTTPATVGVHILNALGGTNNGISFAPYWMWPGKPKQSIENYFNMKRASFLLPVIQNMELSLVTKDIRDDSNAIQSKGMAFGIRTILFGNNNATYAINKAFCEGLKDKGDRDAADCSKYMDVNNNSKVNDAIKEAPYRVGFVLEVGAAWATKYAESNWDKGTSYKTGYWITAAYTTEPNYAKAIDFIGSCRMIEINESGKDTTDCGAKITGYFSNRKWAVSGEYVYRNTSDSESATKYSAIVEYELKNDIYLTWSLGKNYDNTKFDPTSNKKIISMVGLNFGFGDTRTVSLDNAK